jgi:hypothetical protein
MPAAIGRDAANLYPPPMTDATPLAVYRYRLDWQDALAYERLARRMTSLQTVTFYLWLLLAGCLLIALPPELVGDTGSPRFWLTGAALLVAQYLIFWVARGVARLNRARYRYPAPVEIELAQWGDHLVVTTDGKRATVPFEEIGALLPTPERLFIAAGKSLVIVPAAALGGADGMARLVDAIDGFMREKYTGQTAEPLGP